MVLKCLQNAGLQYNIKKCKFHVTKVMYLDLIISYNKIKRKIMEVNYKLDLLVNVGSY